MDYGQRVEMIKRHLAAMLSSYAIPSHLRSSETAQQDEIDVTAKALNQLFPNNTTPDHLSGTFERAALKIKAAHTSRSWPKASDIATAIKSCFDKASGRDVASGPWKPDTYKINAERIKRGEAVGENWINGKLGEALVERGLVTDQDLLPYREAIGFAKRFEEC
jgi:hypothetical protein